jgi:hypothetical protein
MVINEECGGLAIHVVQPRVSEAVDEVDRGDYGEDFGRMVGKGNSLFHLEDFLLMCKWFLYFHTTLSYFSVTFFPLYI